MPGEEVGPPPIYLQKPPSSLVFGPKISQRTYVGLISPKPRECDPDDLLEPEDKLPVISDDDLEDLIKELDDSGSPDPIAMNQEPIPDVNVNPQVKRRLDSQMEVTEPVLAPK